VLAFCVAAKIPYLQQRAPESMRSIIERDGGITVTRRQPGRCPGLAGAVKDDDHLLPRAGLDGNPMPVRNLLRKPFSVQFMSNCL
jgi:hypothetical protein